MDLLTETKTAKKLEQILERRKDRPEEMLWIPAEDIELLVNMAMAGIEMLPQQEHLSWQQIKEFYEIKPFCLVVLSIFLAAETKSGIQNLLTDTEAGWSDLQKLIGINELQSLFQAQLLWWYKL